MGDKDKLIYPLALSCVHEAVTKRTPIVKPLLLIHVFFKIPIHGAMYLPNKSKLKSLIDMHLIKIHAPAQLSWLVLPIHQLKLELIQISYDANNDLFKI